MKISINSTFSYIKFNLNYGSVLQCYALQKYLKKKGHKPEHLRDYRANPKYILLRFKNIVYPVLFLKKIIAQFKLQGFIKRNLELSKRGYISDAGLRKHCPDVDCHIVGSDQIWHNANSFRYLTYAPDDSLKLSYAASFGRASISEEMKRTISPWLERFDGISVREQSAVQIVESITTKKAEHVLDPTLLLDWDEYPYKDNKKRNYCYCYFLNLNSKDDVAFDKIKEIVSGHNKKLILTAPLNYPMFLNENVVFPTVEEWLGLYKNAECIFTNTYHGLLFCIIFKKDFVFFCQKGAMGAENERFYSLLSMLDLEDRMITANDAVQISALMEKKIDYTNVYNKIKEERIHTDKFFEKFGI